jgi:serine/threonine-protein kinase
VQGLTFGKYSLQERLGEGGMAVVWRAKLFGPGGFEKTLVVKQIRDELAQRREFIDLFVAEAKLTVSLTHANIVPVFELGMVEGTYFLALELVDGPPLSDVIDQGPMPPPLAAYVVEQVLRGLDYAHRRGVVHRDLSSANVLLSREGEVKIVDFGIAAPVDARGPAGGSRGYMAPEQEAGGAADARSDLYAVGVLLWELTSGRRFDGSALFVPALQTIVDKATVADPTQRYADAAAMLAAVSRFLRSATGATTQAELGTLVRRRAPDRPLPRDESDDGKDDRAPRVDGPRTKPIARAANNGKAVTFATRIGATTSDVPRSRWLTRVAIGVVAALLVAGGAFAVTRLRAGQPALPRLARTGRVTLHADPPDAKWTVDGTVVAAGTLELPSGHHVVVASAAGREPQTRAVDVAAGATSAVALTLPAARVRLVVRSDPPGADVTLGDRPLGPTPLDVTLAVDTGARLKLRKRDYQPLERAVEPAANGTATIDARLQPLPRGELTLGALPWAHVTIDGDKRADTPLSKVALTAGAHQVRLNCPPTGRELKFTVQIEAGKEIRKVADLRGAPRLIE